MTGHDVYTGTQETAVIQFENANEGRSYPFEDDIELVSEDGRTLPESVITDMHLVLPMNNDAYLSSVFLTESMISVCVKVFSGNNLSSALSFTVSRSSFEPYVPYRMEKLTGFEDIGGIITFGNLEEIVSTFPFRFADKKIKVTESAVSRYTPAAVRKFTDPRTGYSVSGDTTIEFTDYVKASRTTSGVHLELEDGANESLLSDCDRSVNSDICGATPIERLNGVSPDENNRIVIWFH